MWFHFRKQKAHTGARDRWLSDGASSQRTAVSDSSTDREPRRRLLVLSSTYPRWRGDPEPNFVHELARRMLDRFDVMVLCPHSPGAASREILDGVDIVRYRYAPERWETLVNHGGILENLKRHPWKWLLLPGFVAGQWIAGLQLRRRWRPDVVHAHWLLPQGMIAAWSGAKPLIVTSHGADLFALKNRLFKWLRGRVVARACAVTVVSHAMVQRLREECPAANVHVMPMGVDLDELFTGSADIARSRQTILFVGRLVEKKGLIYLVEAMPKVLATYPEARLNIIGFGPDKDRLVTRSRELGLDASVHFLGAVAQPELPRHLRSAAVFVAPFVEAAGGDQEGLGLVVAEAIGCLCPVVVGDVPATRDLFGTDITHVVPQRDPTALAHAILRVLDSPEDAARRAADMRAVIASRFSWAAVAAGYASLFNDVLPGMPRRYD